MNTITPRDQTRAALIEANIFDTIYHMPGPIALHNAYHNLKGR